ncbi:MAG: adenosylhomocysteinase [Sphaerochaetaceae bacterium]|nr:adenosylhomocysteinase [Sphaerochaetaceae bacterium]
MDYDVKDISLAPVGERNIEWVRKHMPILRGIEDRFRKEKPFAGKRVAISIHFEVKTAYLAQVIAAGGAQVSITGSNPLSTQDEAAAALASEGLHVYAHRGASAETYLKHIDQVLLHKPHIIIDDGGDLVNRMHTAHQDLLPHVIGACEETTTGVLRAKAMEREALLRFPLIAVNSAYCKHLFDNRYGTGQSVWDAINSTTNLIVAGKQVVVIGYGWCGKGIAMRAKALGAMVTVCEIDPIKAVEAAMEGFAVKTMDEAALYGEIFVTAAGCRDVIDAKHIKAMRDGAILANAGHFNVEINVEALENLAVEQREQRNNIMGYRMSDGRWIYLIAHAGLVNIAAGNGHPAEIMDLSFSLQALSAEYLLDHHREIGPHAIKVPDEIDTLVARLKLEAWGYSIDTLSAEQHAYLSAWRL